MVNPALGFIQSCLFLTDFGSVLLGTLLSPVLSTGNNTCYEDTVLIVRTIGLKSSFRFHQGLDYNLERLMLLLV